MQGPFWRCRQKCWSVLMTSLLNKFKGMWHSILLFQVQRLFADLRTSVLYICLSLRIVWCSSSMGQQKVSWPLYSPPRYDCIGEGNNTKLNTLSSYMYIHICWATSNVKMENLSNSRDLTLGLPTYVTRAGSGRLLP
jgi:hypothetical protein